MRSKQEFMTIDAGQWVAIARKGAKEPEIAFVRVVTLKEIIAGEHKFDRRTGKEANGEMKVVRLATKEESQRAKGTHKKRPL
jgi:hypothetical protein